jgi:hypothetical protein
VCRVGSGVCDGMITRSEESYRLCVCLLVCALETSTLRRPRTELGDCATGKRVNRSFLNESYGLFSVHTLSPRLKSDVLSHPHKNDGHFAVLILMKNSSINSNGREYSMEYIKVPHHFIRGHKKISNTG